MIMNYFDFLDTDDRYERFKKFISDEGIMEQIQQSRERGTPFIHQIGTVGTPVIYMVYDEFGLYARVHSDIFHAIWLYNRRLDINNLDSLEDQLMRIADELDEFITKF